MRKASLVLAVAFCAPAFGVDKGKAVYVGGTLDVKEKTEAVIELKGADNMVFINKGRQVEIPWQRIEDVEYGQKVGHRIKTAILLSPIALFSKSRHHFVTFAWKDVEGHDQAAVFEFDKEDIRAALAIIHARSGKDISFQDEEARKQMGGGPKTPTPSPSPSQSPQI